MTRRHTETRRTLEDFGFAFGILVTVPALWAAAVAFFLLIDWVVG